MHGSPPRIQKRSSTWTGLIEMSRPEHYQYMRIPARLLRDELLDHRDALHELKAHDISDQEPVPREWQAEGTYDHEVEVGVEWKVEDYTHNGARGGYRLSDDGEPWTWLDENRSACRLSQSAGGWSARLLGALCGRHLRNHRSHHRRGVLPSHPGVAYWLGSGSAVRPLHRRDHRDGATWLGRGDGPRRMGLDGTPPNPVTISKESDVIEGSSELPVPVP